LAARPDSPRLQLTQTREEATMPATVDQHKDRTMSRLGDLLEDAAVIAIVFSFVVLVAAVIVAALVI
jgi:hypothetical protein